MLGTAVSVSKNPQLWFRSLWTPSLWADIVTLWSLDPGSVPPASPRSQRPGVLRLLCKDYCFAVGGNSLPCTLVLDPGAGPDSRDRWYEDTFHTGVWNSGFELESPLNRLSVRDGLKSCNCIKYLWLISSFISEYFLFKGSVFLLPFKFYLGNVTKSYK